MNLDYTDVTLLVDRSGSMVSCWSDAVGGIQSFIEEQQKTPGKMTFTLSVFDGVKDSVLDAVDIHSVKATELKVPGPRGGTALLDAIGGLMNDTGARLAAMPEEERPGRVIFAVITDGEENQSTEFTDEQIKNMIAEQKDKYSWQIAFLSSDIRAVGHAVHLGIANTANKSIGMSLSTYSRSVRQSRVSSYVDFTANKNSFLVP